MTGQVVIKSKLPGLFWSATIATHDCQKPRNEGDMFAEVRPDMFVNGIDACAGPAMEVAARRRYSQVVTALKQRNSLPRSLSVTPFKQLVASDQQRWEASAKEARLSIAP